MFAYFHGEPGLRSHGRVFDAYPSALKTPGNASGRSSAIRPGPTARPQAPCSQTAAEAASNAGISWAARPATRPDSTSPEPAVASHGGRSQPMVAPPSGPATTVSAPL